MKNAQLINGPIAELLTRLTIQMTFGMLAVISFNLVDTFFVSKLGVKELAAMSYTFPVIMIILSLIIGLGAGSSAVISHAIGKGEHAKVQKLTTDGLLFNLLISLVFSVTGLLTIDPLFRLIGASAEEIPLIREYMVIWYSGLFFFILPMSGNAAIRATGDMKSPSKIMGFAVLINLILDPLLIFGIGPFPALGLAGAAIATVIARMTTAIFTFYILIIKYDMFRLTGLNLKNLWHSWKVILFIGAPTAITNIINPISVAFITYLLSSYGSIAVAAFGIASRIEALALAIFMALAAVIGPFVGQNMGANKKERVLEAIRLSNRFCLIYGFGFFLFLFFFREYIVSAFNSQKEIVEIASLYLLIVPLSYGIAGVLFISTTTLNVLKKPLHSAFLNATHSIILYIPLALIGSYFLQIPGIFIASFFSKIITGALGFFILKKILHRANQELNQDLVETK